MSFLINGSSYTSGDGLKDRSLAWPYLFGNLINDDVTNAATDGASFDKVLYLTLKDLTVNSNYKNVIITLPPLTRVMMVRRENNFLIDGNVNYLHTLYKNDRSYVDYLSLYYKHWTNDLFEIKLVLQKILLLQNFLKSNNFNYLFINTKPYNLQNWLNLSVLPSTKKSEMLCAFDLMNDDAIKSEQVEITTYYNLLDKTRYFDPISYNLTTDCVRLGLIDPDTQHPSEIGHRHIANTIYKIWTEIYGD